MPRELSHGAEVRADEIALHQKFLDAMACLRAAESDGDEREARRLRPVVDRARGHGGSRRTSASSAGADDTP